MRSVIIILLCGLSLGSYTQDKGQVKFLVEVDNGYFEILINDTLYLKKYKDSLPEGYYNAKIWSPGYVTTAASFTIMAGQETEVHVPMAKSNERLDFERDYSEYRKTFHKHLTVPVSSAIGTSLITGYFVLRSYDLKKNILADTDLYTNTASTVQIDELKDRIFANNKKYNRNRWGYYVSGSVTAILITGTILTYRYFMRNYTEPKLNSESPFKDRFSFESTPNGFKLTIGIG